MSGTYLNKQANKQKPDNQPEKWRGRRGAKERRTGGLRDELKSPSKMQRGKSPDQANEKIPVNKNVARFTTGKLNVK